MSNTYIETAGRIKIYDSAVRAHDALPVGTYRVQHNPKEGFSLLRVSDLTVGAERVYGDRAHRLDKIFSAHERISRSLGVMLSGNKGQGKSLFLRMIAERARSLALPVVLVTEDVDGIVEFLDTLDECVLIFDEFEKTFSNGRRDRFGSADRQSQFLSLFDGMSSVKRIYCLTVNDLADVSEYIVNRPGRFHYHMRFDYPGPDEVRAYLTDQAPDAAAPEIENAVLFSRHIPVSYDHLRAIAFEMNDPEARFSEIINDLNIKATEPLTYRVDARFASSPPLSDEVTLNIHERGDMVRTIELRDNRRALCFSFRPQDLLFDDSGEIFLPVSRIDILDEYDETPDELPVSVSLTLVGQTSYGFRMD
ncbi:AAA family ATPase [Microbacterium suaedae]|uniref:AAA family ATPase n=1 Tax=Microbacterium suaedae TaxID=2067813 RepID=UPI000DA13A8B|nr:AAA family ATPase [Microbacterium suaedae]